MVQTPHCKVLFAFVRFRNSGRNGSYNNRLLVHSQSKFLRIFGFLFSNKKLAFSLSSIKLFILMHNLFFFLRWFPYICLVHCAMHSNWNRCRIRCAKKIVRQSKFNVRWTKNFISCSIVYLFSSSRTFIQIVCINFTALECKCMAQNIMLNCSTFSDISVWNMCNNNNSSRSSKRTEKRVTIWTRVRGKCAKCKKRQYKVLQTIANCLVHTSTELSNAKFRCKTKNTHTRDNNVGGDGEGCANE